MNIYVERSEGSACQCEAIGLTMPRAGDNSLIRSRRAP
jgi:hypothetical protein